MEVPIDFFLNYAWNPARWPTPDGYLRACGRPGEFGATAGGGDCRPRAAHHGQPPPQARAAGAETYSPSTSVRPSAWWPIYRQLATRAKQVRAAAGRRAGRLLPADRAPIEGRPHRHRAARHRRAEPPLRPPRPHQHQCHGRQARDLFAEDAALTRRYHSFNNGKVEPADGPDPPSAASSGTSRR